MDIRAYEIVGDVVDKLRAENKALREANTRLLDAARALLDEGPFVDDDHNEWACCGKHWNKPHTPDCPYIALAALIAEADEAGRE